MDNKQSIDLKYIYGRGISSLLPFRRPCLYTTVYISSPSSSSGLRPHRQKTPADPHNANNPEWNHPIRLYFDYSHQSSSPDLSLKFDIKTQALLGDKLVGTVHVPLADLASDGPTGTLCHANYQVRGPDGKVNGVLSFSYILNESPVTVPVYDPLPVQDNVTLFHGSSYPTSSNDLGHQEVYPPVEKPDPKPQLYPTVDTFGNVNATPFIYPSSLLPDTSLQVYPPPAMPESKRSLYPEVSTEPVIAYPVLDSGVNRYHNQYPAPFASYPQVEPVVGLASYDLPGRYPPPQASGYYPQTRGWDGGY